MVASGLAGASDPQNAAMAGAKAGETLSGPLFILSIIISTLLTIYGKLPGTKK